MITARLLPEEQYDACLALMFEDMAEYSAHVLTALGLDWPRFAELFRERGEAYAIYDDANFAGFYWVEVRQNLLHLHAIVLKPDYRGKGIGSRVIAGLAESPPVGVEAIELGVHQSNERAKNLYERLGFQVTRFRPEVGFYIMQKAIPRR
jgi:ribosomal protein S18 acetylase RimI-like enzyme